MSPLDAVQPPSPADQQQPAPKKSKTVGAVKAADQKPKRSKPSMELKHNTRTTTMWTLVIVTSVIIIAIWFLLFTSGNLTESGESSRFSIFGEKVSELWESFKTDVLKLQDTLEEDEPIQNVNSEEQIKELEQQVFPQFTDPTKQ